MGGVWVHRITDRDLATGSGVCSECGPVAITGSGRCRNKDLKDKKQARARAAALRPHRTRKSSVGDHGLSAAELAAEYERQQGKCLICGQFRERLVGDHCHATGRFRGMLCHHCNVGIGFLREDPEIMRSAIDYVS